MPQVAVQINGKAYRMACDEGQEAHLLDLAQRFDKYIHNLKGSFGEIGDQRLTVMAGVMVTDEMLELKRKAELLEKEVTELRESRMLQSRERQEGDGELAKGLEAIAEKIETLSKRLSTV